MQDDRICNGSCSCVGVRPHRSCLRLPCGDPCLTLGRRSFEPALRLLRLNSDGPLCRARNDRFSVGSNLRPDPICLDACSFYDCVDLILHGIQGDEYGRELRDARYFRVSRRRNSSHGCARRRQPSEPPEHVGHGCTQGGRFMSSPTGPIDLNQPGRSDRLVSLVRRTSCCLRWFDRNEAESATPTVRPLGSDGLSPHPSRFGPNVRWSVLPTNAAAHDAARPTRSRR